MEVVTQLWIIVFIFDESFKLPVNKIPILKDIFPHLNMFTPRRHSLSPDINASPEIIHISLVVEVFYTSEHVFGLCCLNYLLEEDKVLALDSVDIVREHVPFFDNVVDYFSEIVFKWAKVFVFD